MIRKYSFYGLVLLGLIFACKDKKAPVTTEKVADMKEIPAPKISFDHDSIAKKVTVSIDGKLFTSYVYDGQTPKPILYPILTKSGKIVTRGFPFAPRPNERVDHPHHAGLWLNYGDVNGLDFWNNSYAIPADKKHKYGTIYHQEIVHMGDHALTIKAVWRSPKNVDLLEETTEFKFSEKEGTRQIDRSTTLKALEQVLFKDNKEGMIGIRVTRELELPTDKPAVYTDAEGNMTEVKALNNKGLSGNYFGSEGLTGDDVWGTRNSWVKLEGTMNNETVSVTILDHKNNVGFPTYWHSRGYGLFAANPLGQAIFSEGKERLNFKLDKGASTTFNYRILVHNGSSLSTETLNASFNEFSQ